MTTCTHTNKTLCRAEHKEFGEFWLYQCDDCGLMTHDPVTWEDMQAHPDAPYIDRGAYLATMERITRRRRGDDMTTLQFFAQAKRT